MCQPDARYAVAPLCFLLLPCPGQTVTGLWEVYLLSVTIVLFLCFQTVMNTTRTAFGKHKSGYIFPMLLNVKPMETSFAGIVQELTTSDQFVMFLSKSLVVLEATQETLQMMNVSCYRSLHHYDASTFLCCCLRLWCGSDVHVLKPMLCCVASGLK